MTILQKTIEYFRSAKAEMFKVSWPSRRDTLRYGGLIIGISTAVTVLFATLDYGFTELFDATILKYSQQARSAVQIQEAPQIPVTPTTEPSAEQPKPAEQPKIDLENATPIETPKQ